MNRRGVPILLLLPAFCLCVFVGGGTAQGVAAPSPGEAVDAVVAVGREGEGWEKRQAVLSERVRNHPDTRLIFIGDSITHNWEMEENQPLWRERYGRYQPINLGISGDRTQHVLWRLDHGNLEGISPDVAVVMIGTNNVGDDSAPQIARGVTAIVDRLHDKLPDTRVLLLGIFPRGEQPNDARGKLLQTNQILQKLDDRPDVTYLDIGHRFIDDRGDIAKDIMPDGLHPNAAGYVIWADAMEQTLTQMMKGDEESTGD